MKITTIQIKSRNNGLTLFEVLLAFVLVATLCILAWLRFKPESTYAKAPKSIICVNQFRKLGSALVQYAIDNGDRFPMQTFATNSSEGGFYLGSHAFEYFQAISNSFDNTPKILVCPFDESRAPAANFQTLTDSNVSYFFNVDAVGNSSAPSFLAGDRFLQTNGYPASSGLLLILTNSKISWMPSQHNGRGNILWSDSSVQPSASAAWQAMIESQPLPTNHFLIP